jgi:hypothetical protein
MQGMRESELFLRYRRKVQLREGLFLREVEVALGR